MRELIALLVEDTDPKLALVLRSMELSMDEAVENTADYLREREEERALKNREPQTARRLIHATVQGWLVDIWRPADGDEDTATRLPVAYGEQISRVRKRIKNTLANWTTERVSRESVANWTLILKPEECAIIDEFLDAYPKVVAAPEWIRSELQRAQRDLELKFGTPQDLPSTSIDDPKPVTT